MVRMMMIASTMRMMMTVVTMITCMCLHASTVKKGRMIGLMDNLGAQNLDLETSQPGRIWFMAITL